MLPRSPSPNPSPVDSAADLLRRGDKAAARQTLRRWLRDHRDDEAAWRLLAEAAETPAQVAYCLEQVLRLDPGDLDSVAARDLALRSAAGAPGAANRVVAPTGMGPRALAAREKEQVIRTARISAVVFAGPGILMALGFILGVVGGVNQETWWWVAAGGALLGLVGLVALLQLAMVYFFDAVTLTNRRIIIKRGVLRRTTFEVLLTKVEGIGVDQPLLGRLLSYGTLEVTGTGGAHQAFPGLARPLEFQAAVQTQVDAAGRS